MPKRGKEERWSRVALLDEKIQENQKILPEFLADEEEYNLNIETIKDYENPAMVGPL